MRHERNSRARDRFDLLDVTYAAFQFHRLRANVHKLSCSLHRLRRRVVAVNRHIGDKEGLFHTASRSACVMQHLFERHPRGVLITEHHHAHRIAHENNVDPAFVEQTPRWIIIRCKRGDFLAAPFHSAKLVDRVQHHQLFVRRITLVDSLSCASNSRTVLLWPGKIKSGRMSASG